MTAHHDQSQPQRLQIEYVPPSREVLYRFARQVGEHYGIESPAAVQDMADYLVICAQIKVKQMNTGGWNDAKR